MQQLLSLLPWGAQVLASQRKKLLARALMQLQQTTAQVKTAALSLKNSMTPLSALQLASIPASAQAVQ